MVSEASITTMSRRNEANTIPLTPFGTFLKGAKKVILNTKRESDRQLSDFQAAKCQEAENKKAVKLLTWYSLLSFCFQI